MNDEHVLIRKMQQRLAKHGIRHTRMLVGFSGGADSVALLHALTAALGKENVEALHINHMLRGAESERDERFCRDFCMKHGISFSAVRADVPALSRGVAVEEIAREVRYAHYERVAAEKNCRHVALAHHAGDNLETMIFCLCRGTGLAGISGIPPVRPLGSCTVCRPLIDCTKEEILDYLEKHSLPFVTDSSNADEQYTRNFIRHSIIPALLSINPNVRENAVRTAEIASFAVTHLNTEARTLLAPYPRASAPADRLRTLDGALRYAALSELYRDVGGSMLSAAQSDAVTELLFHGTKGHAVDLSGNIRAMLDGEDLRFLKADEPTPAQDAVPLCRGRNEISPALLVFVGEAPSEKELRAASFCKRARIPLASLPSLFLRPRENGESYRFGGMTRSFKKLLCGKSTREKSRPLFCDGEGILWHPAFAVADRARTEETIPVTYLEFDI